MLDLLSALVARSLVVAEDAPSGERRYRLLETIRQYAEERVDDAERAELRDRHADFYVDFAETAAEGCAAADQLRWLLEVESELGERPRRNGVVGSRPTTRFVPHGSCVRSTTVAELAGPRGCSATPKRYSSCRASRRSSCYPFVLAAAAGSALFHGLFDRADQLCQEALDASGGASDELAGVALLVRANTRYGLGDMTGAMQGAEGAVSACRRFGDPYMLAFSLSFLANMRPRGSTDLAVDEAREALALAREIGAPGVISGGLATLAIVLLGTDPEQSRTLIAESIALHDALGVIIVNENALVMQILVSAVLGEREQTLRLAARGLDRGFSMLVTSCRVPRGHRGDALARAARRRGNAPGNRRRARTEPRAR